MDTKDKAPYIICFLLSVCVAVLSYFVFYEQIEIEDIRNEIRQPIIEDVSHLDGNKHEVMINTLDSSSGVNLSKLSKLLLRNEGKVPIPYLDTDKKVTIGVGRSLQTNGLSSAEFTSIVEDASLSLIISTTVVKNGRIYIDNLSVAKQIFTKPLTEDDMMLLLTDDLHNVNIEAKSVFGEVWNTLDNSRKLAIIDVIYNTGLTRFRKFEDFISAIKSSQWEDAKYELLRSDLAHEKYNKNISQRFSY